MACWGQIAEWGANTIAPAVVGLVMEAQKHAEQAGGQAAEWAAKEVAPRAAGLAKEAQKHAEHVAPAVVAVAMNAKQHAEEISGHIAEWGAKEVAPRAIGLAMETHKHADQMSGHVAHWSNHYFVPAATGLAHNAAELTKNVERHYEQASPDQRTVIHGLVSVGLTVVAEGFGIPLPMLFIDPVLTATGLGTGKALEDRNSKSSAPQESRPSRSARLGRPVVNRLGSGIRETRKETGNGANDDLATIATNLIVLESILRLMAWLL